MIGQITRTILLLAAAVTARLWFNEETVKRDVRGGVSLKAVYPPGVVKNLGDDGEITASLGNFGHIQYGTTVTANVVHPHENPTGCTEFKKFFAKNQMVLVDAGECPVTTKVRNIENAGG